MVCGVPTAKNNQAKPKQHEYKKQHNVYLPHQVCHYLVSRTGDFPRAWSLLLEYIETSALCRNAEVSLAALKSFQEILQISRDTRDKTDDLELPHAVLRPPGAEEIHR